MLPRPPRRRRLGPLAGSLVLHGLGLALAAVVGVGAERSADEPADTFVIGLRLGPGVQEDLGLAESEPEGSPEVGPLDSDALALALLPEPRSESPAEFAPAVADLAPATVEVAPSEVGAEAVEPETPAVLAAEPDAPRAPDAGVAAHGVGTSGRDTDVRARPARSSSRYFAVADARDEAAVPVGPRPGRSGRTGAGTARPASAPRAVGAAGGGGGGREALGLVTPRPSYPRLSVRAGEEGSVLCRLHVSAAGKVTQVDIVESSGYERLDEAARETLLVWRFEPCLRDGTSVAATVLHRVTFRLEG